ncbi:MAG: hypothetical protein WDZ35_04045 [Crocinitomicaceae bacterium]
MLNYILFILSFFAVTTHGQDIPDDPRHALKEYVSLRNSFKRSNTKEFSKTEQMELDDICFAMQKKFPDAYQTDLMWYINNQYYEIDHDKIKSAYSKKSQDPFVLKKTFGYYELTNQPAEFNKLAPKVAKFYSQNELLYYEHVLPASGVLIVSSEEEAWPLYVLQKVKGKGNNVTVVTMDYLVNDAYRQRMATKLGTGNMQFFGNETTFIKTALSHSNVYLSTTVPQAYLDKCTESTYLTGLVYQRNGGDQKALLESFWGQIKKEKMTDYNLSYSEKKLYTNYLPPLLTLYVLKREAGEKTEVLKQAIETIAKKVEQTKKVNAILTVYDND